MIIKDLTLRKKLNSKLKLVHIPYRMYPKDFGKNAAKEAVERCFKNLEDNK